MLIESLKSKLVKGLNIEDSYTKFENSNKTISTCAIGGKLLGDYISCDITLFKIFPARSGYLYVVQFLDHATRFCWVYSMKTRDELIKKSIDVVGMQLITF